MYVLHHKVLVGLHSRKTQNTLERVLFVGDAPTNLHASRTSAANKLFRTVIVDRVSSPSKIENKVNSSFPLLAIDTLVKRSETYLLAPVVPIQKGASLQAASFGIILSHPKIFWKIKMTETSEGFLPMTEATFKPQNGDEDDIPSGFKPAVVAAIAVGIVLLVLLIRHGMEAGYLQ